MNPLGDVPLNGVDSGVVALDVIFRFIFGLVVVLALGWALREFFRHRRIRPAALGELELRYARGELSREDFFMRRFDLVPPPPVAMPPAGLPPMQVQTAHFAPPPPPPGPPASAGVPPLPPGRTQARSMLPPEGEPPHSEG